MTETPQATTRRPVGVRDIPAALFAPRAVFARVEDVRVWGWPLVLLLALVTLIGYATVETGLIDRAQDRQTMENIARIDREQGQVLQRSELRERYEQERKSGEFWKLLKRIEVVAAKPVLVLGSVLLTAAVLYGAVALAGRKPEWHTLLTICVLAAFAEGLRLLVLLALTLYVGSQDVDTSPAPLLPLLVRSENITRAQIPGLEAARAALTGLDPFRLWFWYIVLAGLRETRQLPGWRAVGLCVLGWLVGTGGRVALAAGVAAQHLQGTG